MNIQTCIALSVAELAALRAMHAIPFTFEIIYLFLCIFAFQYLSIKIYCIFIEPRFVSPLRHVPGPKDHGFLIGHALNQFRANGPYELYLSWSKRWPDAPFIRYISFGNTETLLVNSLKAHQEVLQTKCYSFVKPPFLVRIVGELTGKGLVFAEGDEHRRQRRLLNGVFSTSNMKKIAPVVQSHSKLLVRTIEEHIDCDDSAVLEVVSLFSKATLDIIGVITLGKELDDLNTKPSFHECYHHIFNQSPLASLLTAINTYIPLRSWLPLEANRSFVRANEDIKRIIREIIRQRRQEMTTKKSKLKSPDVSTSRDILSYLLESPPADQGQWTEDELLGYLLNFMSAGHETSATTLTWALHVLSTHPKIQKRLRTEILALAQHSDADCAKIESLSYLHNFCREVLRVYAPAVMIWRQAAQTVVVENTVIPAGTNVIISPQIPHFHSSIWGSKAELFDPDRWDALSPQAASPYAFQAFSSGLRVCIGKGLAMLEFKLILVYLVRRFEFEAVESHLELENYVTLRPRGGLRIRFRCLGKAEGTCRDSETNVTETMGGGAKMGWNRKTSAYLG